MDDPRLSRVADSIENDGTAIVVVKGYLSQDEEGAEDLERWIEALREAGWTGAIYQLWWDASNIAGVLSTITKGLPVAALVPAPIAAVVTGATGGGLVRHWGKVKSRARRTGRDHVVNLLRTGVTEPSVSLLGFSLGARVVYYALQDAAKKRFPVRDAVLVGGAVRRDSTKDWQTVASVLTGNLYNVHSEEDWVLSLLFKAGELSTQNPCGMKPIKAAHDRIVNIDVGDAIGQGYKNHFKYRRILPVALTSVGWLERTRHQ